MESGIAAVCAELGCRYRRLGKVIHDGNWSSVGRKIGFRPIYCQWNCNGKRIRGSSKDIYGKAILKITVERLKADFEVELVSVSVSVQRIRGG